MTKLYYRVYKDEAYPGSKKFYVVPARSVFSTDDAGGEESQLSQIPHLSEILLDIAKALPAPKKTKKKN